jgi:hypothetical protein
VPRAAIWLPELRALDLWLNLVLIFFGKSWTCTLKNGKNNFHTFFGALNLQHTLSFHKWCMCVVCVWCVVCGVCGVWRVVCGVVCGVWCVVWCVVCGVWCVVCGVWCVVCGMGVWCVVWCVVCGVWCVVCGVWCVVCGVWCVVCGMWCVVCGVVCGVWGVVCGGWCVRVHSRIQRPFPKHHFTFFPISRCAQKSKKKWFCVLASLQTKQPWACLFHNPKITCSLWWTTWLTQKGLSILFFAFAFLNYILDMSVLNINEMGTLVVVMGVKDVH